MLMPCAIALWLIENTALTFKQIAIFCHLHELEVRNIADGELLQGVLPQDPILFGLLTKQEIDRCTINPNTILRIEKQDFDLFRTKKKMSKYIPKSKRLNKPDAILWLLQNIPNITYRDIQTLLGTTKSTIIAIKNSSYYKMQSVSPKNPVLLGLCSQEEINNLLKKY